jgi:N-methylhydantoinase A/oxoprolinase/acetone carboxylase beta subunit
MKRPADVRIGVDTGGTFTDFVIVRGGVLSTKKRPSTPDNPSRAILEGLAEFLEGPALLQIIHGTTVATNALLERKGPHRPDRHPGIRRRHLHRPPDP